MAQIKVEDLNVIYLDKKNNQYPVLINFSCDFKSDCVNIIAGQSGSGKTTLFKAICGLFEYDGTVYIDGEDSRKISRKNQRISYLSQDLFMFGHMIIYDILAYPLKREKIKATDIDLMIKNIASEFNISHLLTRKPDQLSIGQKQLVLLAKSLIKEPDICLLDEPFSNLDNNSLKMVVDFLKKYKDNHKITLFITTHNLRQIESICDNLCYIKDGKCLYYGSFKNAPKEIMDNVELDHE